MVAGLGKEGGERWVRFGKCLAIGLYRSQERAEIATIRVLCACLVLARHALRVRMLKAMAVAVAYGNAGKEA